MESCATGPAGLAEERDAARLLLQVLQREQSCLVEAEIGALSELAQEKNRCAQRLAELARQREQLLACAGFEKSAAGMQAWLNSAEAAAAERDAWNELRAIAKAVKELNRVNGLLIMRGMARNEAKLNILHGNRHVVNVYGPDGRSTMRSSTGHVVA